MGHDGHAARSVVGRSSPGVGSAGSGTFVRVARVHQVVVAVIATVTSGSAGSVVITFQRGQQNKK